MRISDWSSDVCSSDLAYPDNRGKVVFLQINPPSRSDVADYVDIRRELEAVAGHVTGAFAEYDWAPIRYLNKSFSRREIGRASRRESVCQYVYISVVTVSFKKKTIYISHNITTI